jgi:hypothetical protein
VKVKQPVLGARSEIPRYIWVPTWILARVPIWPRSHNPGTHLLLPQVVSGYLGIFRGPHILGGPDSRVRWIGQSVNQLVDRSTVFGVSVVVLVDLSTN